MDYKVFYRKYRPQNFSSVVGQEYTINMLKNAIMNNKISHAYLFTGPRGTGKTSTAKIFAKTINCENLVNGEACGKCQSCLSFSNSPDIIEIDAASNNGVDDVRELINNVKIAPTESKYKIYIIDEVHMLSQSAFNALLLTLEEPPSHAIFIMATTNVESVPITILSRCQRFNFKKIILQEICDHLKYICNLEQIKITDDALQEIAYLSEGGLRDALSLLDQLSSNYEEITLDSILTNYGSISSLTINKLVEAILDGNINDIVGIITDLENNASDYKVFIKKLIQQLNKKAILSKQNPLAVKISYEQIKDMIFELNNCLNQITIHVNPYLLIQLAILNYIKIDNTYQQNVDNNTVKNTVDNSKLMEKEPYQEKVLDKVVKTDDFDGDLEYIEELKKIRTNNCFASASKTDLINYQNLLKSIQGEKDSLLAMLVDVSLVAASKDNLILTSNLSSTVLLINSKLSEIENILWEKYNVKLKIIVLSEDEWKNLKQEYIQNLKNGVKYKLIDESSLEKKNSKENSQLEKLANELFDSNKIEIIGE